MKKNLLLTLLLCLGSIGGAFSQVRLPAIFTDNMVLQQQSQVAIWGWASANATVRLTTSWDRKSYSTKADSDGKWRMQVATPAASYTPHTITFAGKDRLVLHNVLIGEVWLCSGQSNMEMTMKGFRNQPVEGSIQAILASKNPNLRLFTVKRAASAVPLDDCEGAWSMAEPQTVQDFSATAYFFGNLLQQRLDVPVGLINSSWGGTRIQAWMPKSAFDAFPDIKLPASADSVAFPTRTPTVLYNGMIHPIQTYGMRGCIWYQGETNRNEFKLYPSFFENMVREWRQLWQVGEFPMYYAQIAPYNYALRDKGTPTSSAFMREAQAKGQERVPNVAMAVLMDLNSPNCIHPPKKRESGERLAYLALAQTYKLIEMPYKSPSLKAVEIQNRFITLTFDIPSKIGLTSYDKDITNFLVAGDDKVFFPAKAGISGNQVYLFSPNVAQPVAVRYCFDDTSASEIFTVDGGLPITSFRTDNWDF